MNIKLHIKVYIWCFNKMKENEVKCSLLLRNKSWWRPAVYGFYFLFFLNLSKQILIIIFFLIILERNEMKWNKIINKLYYCCIFNTIFTFMVRFSFSVLCMCVCVCVCVCVQYFSCLCVGYSSNKSYNIN